VHMVQFTYYVHCFCGDGKNVRSVSVYVFCEQYPCIHLVNNYIIAGFSVLLFLRHPKANPIVAVSDPISLFQKSIYKF
jgi:hypothetical protein